MVAFHTIYCGRPYKAKAQMPMTGYNDHAEKVTLCTGTRTWRFKLGLLLFFMALIAAGAGVASLVS